MHAMDRMSTLPVEGMEKTMAMLKELVKIYAE